MIGKDYLDEGRKNAVPVERISRVKSKERPSTPHNVEIAMYQFLLIVMSVGYAFILFSR